MIPLLIESADQAAIHSYLDNHYYLLNLVSEIKPENDVIKIETVRFLLERAKFAPPEKERAVFLIHHGHLMTVPAQNALLKTLEEAKPEEQFIITTHNRHLLLETIVSRCRLVTPPAQTPSPESSDLLKDFAALLTASPNLLIQKSDAIVSAGAPAYLTSLIDQLRQANSHLPTVKRIKILSLAGVCLADLNRNINPKLAVDRFLFKAATVGSTSS